ncbi:WbqC family protein [Pseudomonadota bacterium]
MTQAGFKSKKVAILQSNYIPWKGYFDLVNSVDEFVLYDDVQFTKNDWRNRNIIKTSQGLKWLTIPASHTKLGQLIRDTKIADNRWARKHWAALSQNYSKSPFFNDYRELLESLYLGCAMEYLSEINFRFIVEINRLLGIATPIRWSHEFDRVDGQTERLLSICKQCNATEYVSGPAAKDYFNLDLARQENITISWVDYSGYDEYAQLFPPFEHGVTVLDLLFNTGPQARVFMKSF